MHKFTKCNCWAGYGPMDCLQNVFQRGDLRWIFVGGRSGAGKTTCSCALAVQLSKIRTSVLLVSIYGPHNISNVLEQKFSSEPTKVHGFDNLYVMELDEQELSKNTVKETDAQRIGKNLAKYLIRSLHGYDEALKFVAILKAVKDLNISVVVLDTTCTNDTLGFLLFLQKFEKDFAELYHLKLQFSEKYKGDDTQLECSVNFDYNVFSNEMDKMTHALIQIGYQFKNSADTTLIYVDFPNSVHLSDNKALFNRFAMLGIHTHNIIVNQLSYPSLSHSQRKKYHPTEVNYFRLLPTVLKYIHVTKIPLYKRKPIGVLEIRSFAEHLIKPCLLKH